MGDEVSDSPRAPRHYWVIADHTMSYPDPLIVAAGEEVTLGELATRWPYIWCMNRHGKGGWVPATHVRPVDDKTGCVLRDFDTTELTVHVGEEVTVSREEGGWLWCTNDQGHSGWVPQKNLQER